MAMEIPLERLLDLGTSFCPDAERRHLPEPGAELVAKGSPRHSSVQVCVRLGLPTVEFGAECGRDRSCRCGVQTIPKPTDQRDALFGGEGLEGLGPVDHESRMVRVFVRRNVG